MIKGMISQGIIEQRRLVDEQPRYRNLVFGGLRADYSPKNAAFIHLNSPDVGFSYLTEADI